MILLIYTICIVSVFIFVFLGGILVAYNLKKEILIIEKTKNSEDKKNLQGETAQEETAQIEIVPTEIGKTGWQEIFRVNMDHSYLNLDLFEKKTIQDIKNKKIGIMFENDSEGYDIIEKEELNHKKRP